MAVRRCVIDVLAIFEADEIGNLHRKERASIVPCEHVNDRRFQVLVDGGEKLGHFGGVEISHGVGYALAFSKPEKRQGGRHGFTSKLSLRLRPPRPVEPAKRDTICR